MAGSPQISFKCNECGEIVTDTEHHMLWEHPSDEEVSEALRQLDIAGNYILYLLAEGRALEAIMALYELESLAQRVRGYLEKE